MTREVATIPAPDTSIPPPVKSWYITADRAEVERPAEGDTHPASPWGRVILRIVLLEIDKIAEAYQLLPVDDVDEAAYLQAIAPYLRAMRAAWKPSEPAPLGDELKQIRMGIREFMRWKRKPTGKELSEIVYRALGQEAPGPITGADAEARQVVTAPVRALPPMQASTEIPAWLEKFAEAVGDNEMAQRAFLPAILNIQDESARAQAITAIKAGRVQAKSGANRAEQERATSSRRERKSYVDSLIRELRRMGQEAARMEQEEGQ